MVQMKLLSNGFIEFYFQMYIYTYVCHIGKPYAKAQKEII